LEQTGQAWAVQRTSFALALAVLAALPPLSSGCGKQGTPEAVADAFVEAYFVQVDQEKAKEFTALGATKMLEEELREVAQVRKEVYELTEARGSVTVHRGEPVTREQRIRFPYQIKVSADGTETIQKEADVELSQIQGGWKVVRVGVAREEHAPKP
jgi:transcriptional accessory protein Tex/SPT6